MGVGDKQGIVNKKALRVMHFSPHRFFQENSDVLELAEIWTHFQLFPVSKVLYFSESDTHWPLFLPQHMVSFFHRNSIAAEYLVIDLLWMLTSKEHAINKIWSMKIYLSSAWWIWPIIPQIKSLCESNGCSQINLWIQSKSKMNCPEAKHWVHLI